MQTIVGLAAMLSSGVIGYFCDAREPIRVLFIALVLAVALVVGSSHASSRQGGSVSQGRLILLFGLKYLAVTLLIYGHWQHYLSQSSDILLGYDPQRYFFDAKAWADVTFDRNFTPGNGYLGAVAVYALLFKLCGWSPMIAAALNVSLSFVAMYRLSGLVVVASNGRIARYTVLAGLLAVPDLLWYDCLTGRESLLTSSLVLLAVSCAEYASARNSAKRMGALFLSCAWLSFIAIVRTSMALPGILFGTLGACVPRHASNPRKAIVLVTLLACVLVASAAVSEGLGSQVTLTSFGRDQLIGRSIDREAQYTQSSITRLLATDNLALHFIYSPVRAIFYLINGAHNLYYDWDKVMDPRGAYFQTIAAFLTAIVNIMFLPVLALVTIESFRCPEKRQWRLLTVPFLLTILAIALGTQIVHERYRVPALPFLVGMLFLSKGLVRARVRRAYAVYLCAIPIFIGTIVYLKAVLQ